MSTTSTTATATSNMAITSTSTEFAAEHGTAEFLLMPAEIAGRIDELSCGRVYLSAPVIDGVIQVGSIGRLPTAAIEVHRTARGITVRRADGSGLQANIVGSAASDSGVFAHPVSEVRLHRTVQPDGECRWYAFPGQRNRRDDDLIQFIRTVLAFAVVKQRRSESLSALAESA